MEPHDGQTLDQLAKPNDKPIFMRTDVDDTNHNQPSEPEGIAENGKHPLKPHPLEDLFPKLDTSKLLSLDEQFPAGNEIKSLLKRVDMALAKNGACYGNRDSTIMGFPGTCVHPVARLIMAKLVGEHANHIGMHTNQTSEDGFAGTQALEREAIETIAGWLGDERADGYFTPGGTEANNMGMWIGRNYLWRNFGDPTDPRICVITSILGHYSIIKGTDLLNLGLCGDTPAFDGSGLHKIPCDSFGAISHFGYDRRRKESQNPITCMRQLIERNFDRGIRRFLIVLTAGTSHTGGVDHIESICDMLQDVIKVNPKLGVYVHVDAAHGGFIGPFMEEPIQVGFAHKLVSSVTVDPHKMGFAPYPAGLFLARQGLPGTYISRPVGYIGSHVDNTISGSRSGAAAVAVWGLLKFLGFDGYKRIVKYLLELTNRIREILKKHEGLYLYESELNIIAFTIDNPEFHHILVDQKNNRSLTQEKLKIIEAYNAFRKKYCLPGEELPTYLDDPNSLKRQVHKIVVMPHAWVLERCDEALEVFDQDLTELLGIIKKNTTH